MSDSGCNLTTFDCLICAEPCEALAVFGCGHCVCYLCGLRIHSLGQSSCPVCRKPSNSVIVTRTLPEECLSEKEADHFNSEAIHAMQAAGYYIDRLKCYVVDSAVADELTKLCGFLCPLPSCWSAGKQEPFYNLEYLKQHLQVDHKLSYCKVCLEHRKVFLCEQQIYAPDELPNHSKGCCAKDSLAFTGHPPCHFCKGKTFYDEGHLIKHMQQEHFTCDFCTRSEFSFTYYQNRAKLLKHYERDHKLCDHPDCAAKDPVERAFASELDLAVHRQRVHGVRSRVPLFFGEAAPGAAEPASRPFPAATPATTSAFYVIFDNVTSSVTLELLPSGANHGKKSRGGGNKGGAGVSTAEMAGLPTHFRDRRSPLAPLTRMVTADLHSEHGQHKGEQQKQNKKQQCMRAFGVSESAEEYNKKNHVPTGRNELQRALDAALETHLSDPRRLADLRACTASFMAGEMLVTRYYDYLRTECFVKENTFNAVFPLLVATVPQPDRRDALVEVEKMRHSPETQRAYRQREEERCRRAENEKWRTQREYAQSLAAAQRSAKNNKAKKWNSNTAGHNVWLERGGASVLAQSGPQREERSAWGSVNSASVPLTDSSSSNNGAQNNSGRGNTVKNNNKGGHSGGNGGAARNDPSSVPPYLSMTAPALHADPENFPALPSSNMRRVPVQQRQKQQPPNAWFKRK